MVKDKRDGGVRERRDFLEGEDRRKKREKRKEKRERGTRENNDL